MFLSNPVLDLQPSTKFENGTAGNISLSTFIVLLKVVGQINTIDNIFPELPESPYLMRRDDKKSTACQTL